MYRNAHTRSIKIFGENQENTLAALNGIGLALLKQEHYTDCLEIFMHICKNVSKLGEDNDVVLDALLNLGLTYFRLGNYEKALNIYRKVYSKRSRILGENHPDTLKVLKRIELALMQQKN